MRFLYFSANSARIAFCVFLGVLAHNPGNTQEKAKGVLDTVETVAIGNSEENLPNSELQVAPAAPAPSKLIWWNREIVEFRSARATLSPAERSEKALENIEAVSEELLDSKVKAEQSDVEGQVVYRFLVEEEYLFTLVESDLDELAYKSIEDEKNDILERLEEIRQARIEQRSAEAITKAIVFSLIATFILILSATILIIVSRYLAHWLESRTLRLKLFQFPRIDLRPQLGTLIEQLVKFAGIAAVVYLVCVWIALVLKQFPLTEPLGAAFRERLWGFASDLFGGAIGSIPGLITVIVIFFFARWCVRIADRIIRGLGKDGGTSGSLLSPDAARATRRIVAVVFWIIAIVVAYPYLPGSESAAFKGISVLVGLMVTLGSTGLVNQIMSGFVLLYSGSLRTGEYIKLGETEGKVTEMGILAVKLLTPRREFVTVPNAVVIQDSMTNYSRLSNESGVTISTDISIGYDTPWQKVEELLLEAARTTGGVLHEQHSPRVLQRALSDWYVEYTLVCFIDLPEKRVAVLSELNGRILDCFHGKGIQIMSPHFRDQPSQPVLPPKDPE